MTIEQFDILGLKAGDRIEIEYVNHTTSRELLMRDHAYHGHPDKTSYPSGRIVPGVPPSIIVQDKHTGGETGIPIATVKAVTKIRSI